MQPDLDTTKTVSGQLEARCRDITARPSHPSLQLYYLVAKPVLQEVLHVERQLLRRETSGAVSMVDEFNKLAICELNEQYLMSIGSYAHRSRPDKSSWWKLVHTKFKYYTRVEVLGLVMDACTSLHNLGTRMREIEGAARM